MCAWMRSMGGERPHHRRGEGDHFGAFASDFGRMSGLICGENSNPLAVFALIAEGTRVHVMSWPNHFPTSGEPLRNRVAIDSQAFAQMSKAFVISACGTVDDHIGRFRSLAEAGVQTAIVNLPDLGSPEPVERFAEIIAAFAP